MYTFCSCSHQYRQVLSTYGGGLQSSVQSVFCSQLLLSHPRDVFATPIVSYLVQVRVSTHAPRQIGLKYRLKLPMKYYFYFRSVQQSWHRVIELCLLICTNQFCNLQANDPQKIIFTYMYSTCMCITALTCTGYK